MPKFTRRAYTERGTKYRHDFKWKDSPGGFSFDCDENGVPKLKHEAARENYSRCINGEYDVIDNGIIKMEWTYRHRSYIECEDCKQEVGLYNFTNTCECGADYNMSGYKLAPRHFWGEETGEHWTECY